MYGGKEFKIKFEKKIESSLCLVCKDKLVYKLL